MQSHMLAPLTILPYIKGKFKFAQVKQDDFNKTNYACVPFDNHSNHM